MYAQQQQHVRAGRGVAAVPMLPVRSASSCARCRRTASRMVYCAAASVEASSSYELEDNTNKKAFPYPVPMDPMQKVLASIPLMLFYPTMLACVGAAGFLGVTAGRSLPVDSESRGITSIGAAAVMSAAAVYGAVQAKKKRDSAAVVDLYNAIVELPEPPNLTEEMVSAVESKYGINMAKQELDGLQRIYGQYLESVIPTGDIQLKGTEADNVKAFKEALGLSDEDAAIAHIDVARRLYRQTFETKDRNQQWEQRKAFQRLVYVSQLVYGDQKAAYLLPWRRLFNVTESQLLVARRDNAKMIFKQQFEADGGHLKADRHFLRELRDKQLAVKMMDESAVEVVGEYARRHVEGHLIKALDAIKATGKNKDITTLMSEVEYVLDYSHQMAKMADDGDLVPGLGPVTVKGADIAGRARELKDLFRLYLEEKTEQQQEFSAALDQEARELQAILNLTTKDAQAVRDEVSTKLYRQLLREEVTSRRIDAAASPASVLQALCEKVRMRPEAAAELHEQLYSTKLASLVEQGALSEQDQQDLARIRRILCLPAEAASKAAKDTCGKVLEQAIRDVFSGGARPLSEEELSRVDKVVKDLVISSDVALGVLTQVVRERFRSYVEQSQKQIQRDDRREAAGHIKKMLRFNQLVVTPLLARLKGQSGEVVQAAGQAGEEAATATSESAVSQVAKAIQAERSGLESSEPRHGAGQCEIGLREDLDEKMRAEVYKSFFMATMSGGGTQQLPMGSIRRRSSASNQEAEMARVTQLSGLLGMSQAEIKAAQADLSELAYKSQVEEVMRSGSLTPEKTKYLEELRTQLGIGKEAGDKVVRAAKSEVTQAGGNLQTLVDENARKGIFRKELESRITDGSGNLDAEFLMKQLPELLALTDKQLRPILKELVASRKRMLLVQAISQYRQKRPAETVVSLQNLLSCARVLPEPEPMQWSERAELRDIFQAFCSWDASQGKRSELAQLLGLSEDEALELGAASDSEEGRSSQAGEEAFF